MVDLRCVAGGGRKAGHFLHNLSLRFLCNAEGSDIRFAAGSEASSRSGVNYSTSHSRTTNLRLLHTFP